MHRSVRVVAVLLVSFFSACAEPPSKEMNQAQGAIDAAKAAGAEAFAPAELAGAVEALRQSEQAASERDYRLALSHAIDSRERAQNAAKVAVDARARARGEVEAQIAEVSTLLGQARERLRDPEVMRLPRRAVQEPRAVVDSATKSLQDARTALNRDDYAAAKSAIEGAAARIQKVIADLDEATDTTPGRRRR